MAVFLMLICASCKVVERVRKSFFAGEDERHQVHEDAGEDEEGFERQAHHAVAHDEVHHGEDDDAHRQPAEQIAIIQRGFGVGSEREVEEYGFCAFAIDGKEAGQPQADERALRERGADFFL